MVETGETRITLEEAGRRLDVTRRTVWRYATEGYGVHGVKLELIADATKGWRTTESRIARFLRECELARQTKYLRPRGKSRASAGSAR